MAPPLVVDLTDGPTRTPARLVSAAWVVPIATPPLREGAVVVDVHGSILDVGTRADLLERHPEAEETRAEGALLPGLVNAHTHLELSALAGQVPGGQGLIRWVGGVGARSAALPPQDRLPAARSAALAATAAGTAAVGETCNTLDCVPALAHAGLRGVVFHELVGSRDLRTGDALADAEAERTRFLSSHTWPEGVAYVVSPHAPYSVSPDLFRRIFAAAGAADRPTSLHVAEDPEELSLLATGTGAWPDILSQLNVPDGERTPRLAPVAYLETLGAFTSRPPLLVHMVHASPDDRQRAHRHGAPVVLCARSNLHIGGKLPDVDGLRADGLALALGTDSLASAPDLSLWGEMATLATAFPSVAPAVWLRAAAQGGAEALALPELGALAAGRKPGVIDVTLPDGPIAAARSSLDLTLRLVRASSPAIRWIARA